jgi:hypothetical protein
MDTNRKPEESRRRKLPSIHHPDVCDYEDVVQSHLGANLSGVEVSDFDDIEDDADSK